MELWLLLCVVLLFDEWGNCVKWFPLYWENGDWLHCNPLPGLALQTQSEVPLQLCQHWSVEELNYFLWSLISKMSLFFLFSAVQTVSRACAYSLNAPAFRETWTIFSPGDKQDSWTQAVPISDERHYSYEDVNWMDNLTVLIQCFVPTEPYGHVIFKCTSCEVNAFTWFVSWTVWINIKYGM